MKKTVKILDKEYDIEKTTVISLSYRNLTEIPSEVNELVNLEVLWLSYNKIKKIYNLDNLKKLKKLYLYNNEIERIEGLDNNKNLTTLSLNNNKIKKIENIHHLEKLKGLRLFKENTFENVEEAKKISLINERARKLERI